VENAGVLSASGLIAGEALVGLFIAAVVFVRDRIGGPAKFWIVPGFETIAPWLAIPVFVILALYLIYVPLSKAGRADEPAPPTAIM
jgi:sterol desaturase/sphingolipid hydroxylase (fatty acid hydroxylase superfamily)